MTAPPLFNEPEITIHGNCHVEIPVFHRQLWPREQLRRGDKFWCDEKANWEEIPNAALEEVVAAPDESNDFVRYCRPVSPRSQIWHVDESAEAGGLGGLHDPFESLEVAQETIENAAKKAKLTICGMIFHVNGTPLMAYDLPQSELPDEEDESEVEEAVPASEQELDVLGIEFVAEAAGREMETVRRTARKDCPSGFRVRAAGEAAQEGDLWYGPTTNPEVILWQPCPEALIGVRNPRWKYILARPVYSGEKNSLSDQVVRAEKLAGQLARMLAEIQQDLADSV